MLKTCITTHLKIGFVLLEFSSEEPRLQMQQLQSSSWNHPSQNSSDIGVSHSLSFTLTTASFSAISEVEH